MLLNSFKCLLSVYSLMLNLHTLHFLQSNNSRCNLTFEHGCTCAGRDSFVFSPWTKHSQSWLSVNESWCQLVFFLSDSPYKLPVQPPTHSLRWAHTRRRDSQNDGRRHPWRRQTCARPAQRPWKTGIEHDTPPTLPLHPSQKHTEVCKVHQKVTDMWSTYFLGFNCTS